MAKLTSHTLNGADGSHASAIPVTLEHVISKKSIFSSRMDSGGRLSVDIDPKDLIAGDNYQLTFNVSEYWKERKIFNSQILNEITVRISSTKLISETYVSETGVRKMTNKRAVYGTIVNINSCLTNFSNPGISRYLRSFIPSFISLRSSNILANLLREIPTIITRKTITINRNIIPSKPKVRSTIISTHVR